MPDGNGELTGSRIRGLETSEEGLAGNGIPAHTAADGTPYWDYTNTELYINDSGVGTFGNSWQHIGGGGVPVPHQLLDNPWHTDTVTNTPPAAGSIVVSTAGFAWSETVHPGVATQYLRSNAAIPGYSTILAGDLPNLGAMPNLTYGVANAPGAAATYVRTDATIDIFDAIVPGTIQCDDPAGTGVTVAAARRDHQHAIVNAIAVNIGNANAEGVSTSFSRADHVHDHVAGLGVNLHHNEAHVVNSTGPHAEAGLTIGHVLRASGAAAFSFAALIAADLPAHGTTHDVGAGDPVTTTSDGAANHSRILASSAAGAITMDDYFTVNGGTIGIPGNELLTFNVAGTIVVGGANFDLDGNDLILDADGDSFLHASADDVVDLVLAGAGGEFGITINGAEDFNFTANSFNVPAGSVITMADDALIQLAAVGGRIEFDSTPAIDEINFRSCNVALNKSTPLTLLHLEFNGRTPYAHNTITGAMLLEADPNAGAGNFAAGIVFGEAGGSPAAQRGSAIYGVQTTADVNDAGIGFAVHGSTAGDPRFEAARFNEDGFFGINTIDPDRILHPEATGTSSTSMLYALRIGHRNTAGAGGTLFGVGMEFELEDSAGNMQVAAEISTLWGDATSGSEQPLVRISPYARGSIGPGNFGLWTFDGIAGGGEIIIPNGINDVTISVWLHCHTIESAGGIDSQSIRLDTPGAGVVTGDVYDDGVDVLTATLASTGQLTIARSAGAATFNVICSMLWM